MALADASAWFVAVLLASFLRYEFDMWRIELLPTAIVGLGMAAFSIVLGILLGVYLGKYAYGSLDEVRIITVVGLITSLLFSIVLIVGRFEVPRSLALLAFPLALMMMFGVRFLYRLSMDRTRLPARAATPALIVGAGQAGEITVRTIMNDPDSPMRAVGLIDDDITKRRLRLHGVPVL